MTNLINYRPRVLENSCVRVVRKIKGTGSLSVAKNQEVSPHDVIGNALVSPGFTVLNISRELNISPKEAIASLQKSVGVPLYKGELLARKKSLFGSKNFVSPTDCIIEKTNQQTGEVTLKMLPKQIPLLAGVFGVVEEINSLTGEIYIKTMATQIIGLFGSGRERGGFLRILGNQSNLINSTQIKSSMKGEILVTGGFVFGAALKKAMEYQIDGLVSGGLNMDDYVSIAGSLNESHKSHSDIGMSVLATEGFGPLPIGDDIFETLKNFEGKFAFVNGFSATLVMPESSEQAIVKSRKIALPPIVASQTDIQNLGQVSIKSGLRVRIIWPPYAASQGVILSVDNAPTLFPSGVSAVCATVELPNKKIKVPINNLEAI